MNKSAQVALYFLIVSALLGATFLFLNQRIDTVAKSFKEEIKSLITKPASIDEISTEGSDTCGEACQKIVASEVAKAVATISATKKVTTTVTPTAKNETSYISITGPFTATSTEWIDIKGTDFYLDLANDYGSSATTSWEANLKVAHSNGVAYARLFDVTHGIAVSGSELSVSNNSALTLVTSKDLNIWSGRNLYRVQLKSLNSFEVTFGSGRVKISY